MTEILNPVPSLRQARGRHLRATAVYRMELVPRLTEPPAVPPLTAEQLVAFGHKRAGLDRVSTRGLWPEHQVALIGRALESPEVQYEPAADTA